MAFILQGASEYNAQSAQPCGRQEVTHLSAECGVAVALHAALVQYCGHYRLSQGSQEGEQDAADG